MRPNRPKSHSNPFASAREAAPVPSLMPRKRQGGRFKPSVPEKRKVPTNSMEVQPPRVPNKSIIRGTTQHKRRRPKNV